MAKILKIKITNTDFNGVMANQMFNTLTTSNQLGDKFYVPKQDMLLILGTGINARDREGNEILDEAGNPVRRQVGQHFCAVRLIDNKPVEVRELYVGQLVKVDVNRRIAFPGILSDALQKGDAAFKDAICGKVLEIVDEKMVDDRVWDNAKNQWMRKEDGTLASGPKNALKFEPKRNTMSAEDIDQANSMLMQYYKERYSDYVVED